MIVLKKITKSILSFVEMLTHASYAAHLARNQQWKRAQEHYKK
jgi:hypothetical protein